MKLDSLLIRLDAIDERLDARRKGKSAPGQLGSRFRARRAGLRLGSGHFDALGLQPGPKLLLGDGLVGTGQLRHSRLSRQDHRIGETAHQTGQRFDQDTGKGSGQPCGDTFISPKYVCRVGLNTATSAELDVHIEADDERAGDIKRAIFFYTNSPNRIRDVQARIAIQDGLEVSVYGFSQNERLSRLGLDRVVLKEIREKAELLENYIEKAPKYDGDVYRGVWFSSSKEAQGFISDLKASHAASVDSWSASKEIAERFAGVSESRSVQRAAVVLRQKNVHGASIKSYSGLPEEEEVLQPSGLRYKVLSVNERVEGSLARPLTIYEVEVEPIEHRPMRRKTVLDSALGRLDALEQRCDARRKTAEGQLGLFGDGDGGGKACGGGWIRPDYTCHKEGGAQPAQQQEAPSEARRSRPKETIYFPQAIEGPSGAKLRAYTWQYTVEEVLDNRGELAERRVSDWEKSLANVETGRNVVHQFEVEVNGKTKVVSAESAIQLLGYVSDSDKKAFGSLKSTARTVARLRMAQHELDQTEQRWQKDWDEVEAAPKPKVKVGEWSPEPPGFPREGHRRRTWKMGDIEVDQIWNSLDVDSDEDQAAHLFARWKADEMKKRGWGYSGQRKTSMRSYVTRTRDDLQKRIVRAEAKLKQTARQDADNTVSRLLDVLNERLDALKRKCSTGYGCGSTCISVQKECRSVPGAASSKERLQRLEQLARGEIKPRGIGVLKPEEARAKAAALSKPSTPAPAERTAKPKRTGRPSVVVNLRRAKPGGEYGPDGHWYPGGAWMSEGSYVGIKTEVRPGVGEGRDLEGKGKSGPETPKVVQPREKPRRLQPTEPKGEGLPRPTGLKKMAQKNDEEFFNDRGYIRERLPYGDQRLTTPAFQAAVAQRMTTEELNWATDQILRITGMSKDDFDFGLYGGEKEALDYNRSLARNQLTGVDDDRLKAAIVFMEVSQNLGYTSPAQKRLRERRKNFETQSTAPQRRPRAQVEGKKDPGYGDFVWALNNVFRAVRIRRGGSNA